MDPLSVASGVAGLFALADIVISRTYNTIIACKNASKDARRLLQESQTLLGILQSVWTLEKKIGSSALQSRIPSRAVLECQKTLQHIRDKLGKADPKEDGISLLQRATRTLKWPISCSETEGFLADMETHKSTFNLAMSVDALDLLLAAAEEQAATSGKIDKLAQGLQQLIKIEMTKETRRLLDKMGADSADEPYRMNLDLHYPGTCLWFLEGSYFRNWCALPNAKLWVYGIPGAGKTILSALAVQQAMTHASKTRAVVFYYSSFRNDRTRHLAGILSCFVGQLARQNEECLAILQEKFEASGDVGTPPWINNETDLHALLDKMCLCFDDVSILIDGIDECYDASAIAEALAHLGEKPTVRLFVSSREEHHIQYFLESFEPCSIAAESQDLRLYVPAEIENRLQKRKLRIQNPDLKDEIVERLVTGAKGILVFSPSRAKILLTTASGFDGSRASWIISAA